MTAQRCSPEFKRPSVAAGGPCWFSEGILKSNHSDERPDCHTSGKTVFLCWHPNRRASSTRSISRHFNPESDIGASPGGPPDHRAFRVYCNHPNRHRRNRTIRTDRRAKNRWVTAGDRPRGDFCTDPHFFLFGRKRRRCGAQSSYIQRSAAPKKNSHCVAMASRLRMTCCTSR